MQDTNTWRCPGHTEKGPKKLPDESMLVLNWYEEQLERVKEAKLEAMSHLEECLHEVSSVAGTFPGKKASPQLPPQLYSKSVVTCSYKIK